MGGLIAGTLPVAAEQATGRGTRGVVLAAAPQAAALGAEAMRGGGNAYDAVVTAALAETVLLPPKCGLAGDLIALVIGPGADHPEALLAIGPGPIALADAARCGDLATTGPMSVGVPGAPAGYAALADRGNLGLSKLCSPAVVLAVEGFVWAQICTVLQRESVDLVAMHNPGGTAYFPDGAPIPPGEIVRLPRLGHLLAEFADRGAALFAGDPGRAVVDHVRSRGGVLQIDDMAAARAEWAPPETATVRDHRLWATPAPTHGPSLLDAVAGATGPGEGALFEAVVAAARRRTLDLSDPSGTSMVAAADATGTVVVVVHSNSYPRFGSGLVVPEYDLILNNRPGRGFSHEPGHPNAPAPGRRPATTLHAWAIRAAGEDDRVLVGATPGGENQMPWNAQTIARILRGEWDPGMLVVTPRWEWREGDTVGVEDGFGDEDLAKLERSAASVERVPAWGLRCAQQVIAVPRPGVAITGAVDPRTGGAAVAV